ncbi:MAG TPA: glycosyltransferase [Desulfomonilaceae bacterium]|nr:glycosyltransferase [Desulfomonilaceae bacterium]
MKNSGPIVIISSYPPRLCGIATFAEEAREFIQKANPGKEVLVISHTDGQGDGVFPIVDMSRRDWWKVVAEKVKQLNPTAVHLEHEYGLYEYLDSRGQGDGNEGFLELLDAINEFPLVVEPHTIHGRLTNFEANFVYQLCERAHVVLFKCHYQKWRLDWNFVGRGWKTPKNVMVVPHGSRPDRRWGMEDVAALRQELGLDKFPHLGEHIVGLVGWIQSNKRWDILTSMWEDIHREICERSDQKWDLLAAGTMRDPNHTKDYESYRKQLEVLEGKGLAHYFEFVPRGEIYYKVSAVCDFIVLPSVDETQSGTLARIIALNKPFITTAPMEGLTAQTLESKGGLLFTTKQMLKEEVIEMACNEQMRLELGENLKRYLEEVVSWEVVANQYNRAYELAREACSSGKPVELPFEF